MGSHPTWIGDRGLFGYLHVPDQGAARAAVVVCPSLGAEAAWSYRGLRGVAEGLCRRGLAVLRFDYGGSGQSAGDIEGGSEVDFAGDVREAFAYLATTGLRPAGAVVFGIGAAVLAEARAGEEPLDAVALWQPAVSGRRWVREQTALIGMGGGSPPAPLEPGELPGLVLPPAVRSDIERMKTRMGADLTRRALVLSDPEGAARRLAEDAGVDWVEAVDSGELLFGFRRPLASMGAIVDWMDRCFAGRPDTRLAMPVIRDSVSIPVAAGGAVVRERFAGPQLGSLFGVVTEPVQPRPTDYAVFVTTSTEPAIGPGRAWVHLARALAQHGWTVLRLDLHGFGDSPPAEGQYLDTCYPAAGADDVVAAIRALTGGATGSAVVGGMCSGSYFAIQAAARIPTRTVIGLSPVFEVPRVMRGPQGPASEHAGWRTSLRAVAQRPAVLKLRRRAGAVAWRMAHVTGVRRSPVATARSVAAQGAELVLVCGPDDAERLQRRGGWILNRLMGQGRVRYSVLPHLGHSVLTRDERLAVEALLLDHLVPTGPSGDFAASGQRAAS
ncbi:MAG TPA: alpha/beta hydrolase family protein [Acidimicrobiales bacterium]|nr:alpha/beta hydrolase family protein [Acidimicrobiales bacterium]